MARVLVFRAAQRRPVVRARRPERAANLAARRELVRELGPLWQNVADRARAEIDDHRLAATIARGGADLDMVMAAFEGPAGSFLASVFRDAIEAGSDIGARHSGISGRFRVSGEQLTERMDAWMRTEGAKRITRVAEQARRTAREVVADVLRDGVSPTRAAQDVGRLVGLTPRQAASALNYERELLRRRIPTPQADTQHVRESIAQDVERYRDRLLHQRGQMIVETESQYAIHQGERLWWRQAAEEHPELVNLESLGKTWSTVSDDRVCQICEPLHGVTVPFDEDFATEVGPLEAPPAHPLCRCFLTYDRGEDAPQPEDVREEEPEQERQPEPERTAPRREREEPAREEPAAAAAAAAPAAGAATIEDFAGFGAFPKGEAEQVEFVRIWNEILDRPPARVFAEMLHGTGLQASDAAGRVFKRADGSQAVRWSFKMRDAQGNQVGMTQRVFTRHADGRFVVENALLEIDDSIQSRGVGKLFQANQMRMMERLGVDRVELLANIDVGGYAWARYGYVPSEAAEVGTLSNLASEIRGQVAGLGQISDQTRAELLDSLARLEAGDGRAVWEIADRRDIEPESGQALGKKLLLGRNWYGELNLRDEAAVKRFKAYVGIK